MNINDLKTQVVAYVTTHKVAVVVGALVVLASLVALVKHV